MRKFLSNLAVVLLCFAACGCSGGSGEVSLSVGIEPSIIDQKKHLQVKAAGEKVTLPVAGPAWEAVSSTSKEAVDWLKPSKDAMTGGLLLTAEKNYTTKNRDAEVLVKAIDGEASETIYVEQKKGGMPENAIQMDIKAPICDLYPLLKENGSGEIEVSADASTHNFKVLLSDSKFTWRVIIEEEAKDWIYSPQTSTQKGKSALKITLTKNLEVGERTSVVKILCEYKGGEAAYLLRIKQQPTHHNEDPALDDEIEW
jgi:hypothetical protein